MKTYCLLVVLLFALPLFTNAQSAASLRLVQTIPLPNVKGRIDHIDADVKGKRLFVAGLENGSLEVVDLRAGKWTKSIPGFKKTQGVAYIPSLNKVFVASGDDGMLRVFRGNSLELLDAIKLDLGPNRVVYDPHAQLLYVGYGGRDAVNAKDNSGDTPLHKSAFNGHKGVAELLLANGAEINVINNKGKTPLYLAAWKGMELNDGHERREALAVAELLRQHGGRDRTWEIEQAAQQIDVESVRALLKDDRDLVFCKDYEGRTPLHLAGTNGHKGVAELLLTSGAEVNVINNKGETPLHWAVTRGHKGVVELLLQNKADVNAKDNLGETPLHKAAQFRCNKDMAALLLAN